MSRSDTNRAALQHRKFHISWDWIGFSLFVVSVVLAGGYLLSAAGASARAALSGFLALDSEQATWFLTRAAGILAYLLLWLSTVWGLAIPSKLLGEVLSGDFTFDFHQFISLLSLGFLGLHIVVLTADRYLPFSVVQLLVPFLAPYRPLWVGIGVIAFYLLLLVTVTFYLRKQIGRLTFRYIHYASLAAYLGAILHALFSGTDSSLPAVLLLYISTFAVVLFLTLYWLVSAWVNKTKIDTGKNRMKRAPAARSIRQARNVR